MSERCPHHWSDHSCPPECVGRTKPEPAPSTVRGKSIRLTRLDAEGNVIDDMAVQDGQVSIPVGGDLLDDLWSPNAAAAIRDAREKMTHSFEFTFTNPYPELINIMTGGALGTPLGEPTFALDVVYTPTETRWQRVWRWLRRKPKPQPRLIHIPHARMDGCLHTTREED